MTTQSSSPRSAPRPFWELAAFAAVIGIAVLTLLRQLTNDALGYPDADRILMDGVFFRDFLVDLPLLHPYDYIVNYFGQYPALSIGYRPPFFPFVEGLFNLVLGVEIWSSRLALLAFALGGITAFYLLMRRTFDSATAAVASLFLVTTPFVARFGWYTMAEVPVLSMALITAYFFQRYISDGRTRDLVFTTIALVLAMYTKQTAMVLALWMIIYVLGAWRILEQLRQRRVWITLVVSVIAVLPLVAVTLWLVFRALPLRAPIAGLLGGAGATVASDAVIHLLCPMANLAHVLVWHSGAMVAFMAAGWLVGTVWQRIRWRGRP